MSNPNKSVPVGIWKRFETYGLQIVPSLAGMVHEFDHHGCRVKIQLPGRPRQSDWDKESSKIRCLHYRQRNGKKYPASYLVNSVDMTIETGKFQKIPQNAIGSVNHSLFNSPQLKSLDNFTERYEVIVDSAFERWLDVLRWKTGIHTICPYHENRQKSLWGPYLFDVSSNQNFYRPPFRITVTLLKSVSKKNWSQVQGALVDNIDVPIWHIYMSEAHQKREIKDIRGFILNLAISIETMVRSLVNTYIVESAAPTFKNAVGRINISVMLDKWSKINSKNKRWKDLKKEIALVKRVFKERNDIVHRGVRPILTEKEVNEIAQAVLVFLNTGEKQVHKFRNHLH